MDIIRIENNTITVEDIVNREIHVIKIQINPIKAIQEIEVMQTVEATQKTEEIQIIEVILETVEVHHEQIVQITIDLLGI